MTEYRLSNLGLQENELCLGLEVLGNCKYTYLIHPDDNDIIIFMGKIDDPTAPLPLVNDIKNAYDQALIDKQAQLMKPKLISNKVTTSDSSFTFVTCPEGNACVTIPIGSNSVASTIDSTKMENQILVNNNEYINQVANLPIYKYNITGQPSTSLRIAPTGNDWNNVFNFESKDPTKQNIELMDMIGVMLSCIQNLNARIAQLENN